MAKQIKALKRHHNISEASLVAAGQIGQGIVSLTTVSLKIQRKSF